MKQLDRTNATSDQVINKMGTLIQRAPLERRLKANAILFLSQARRLNSKIYGKEPWHKNNPR